MISVTPAAAAQLKLALDSLGFPRSLLRITPMRGPHGCIHGYTLLPVHEATEDDRLIESDGVRFVVREDLVPFLQEARIDWAGDYLTVDAPGSPPPRHEGHCEDHHVA